MSELATFLTVITGLIAVFVSLFTAVNAVRKDAYKELKDLVHTLQARIGVLENELKRKDREIEKRDEMIDKRDRMIDDLKLWAEELVNQVKAAGLEPVPFSRKRRGENG